MSTTHAESGACHLREIVQAPANPGTSPMANVEHNAICAVKGSALKPSGNVVRRFDELFAGGLREAHPVTFKQDHDTRRRTASETSSPVSTDTGETPVSRPSSGFSKSRTLSPTPFNTTGECRLVRDNSGASLPTVDVSGDFSSGSLTPGQDLSADESRFSIYSSPRTGITTPLFTSPRPDDDMDLPPGLWNGQAGMSLAEVGAHGLALRDFNMCSGRHPDYSSTPLAGKGTPPLPSPAAQETEYSPLIAASALDVATEFHNLAEEVVEFTEDLRQFFNFQRSSR